MKDALLRNRGYLPHLEIRESAYFVTLRLVDTLPATTLRQMRMELLQLRKDAMNESLNALEELRLKYL